MNGNSFFTRLLNWIRRTSKYSRSKLSNEMMGMSKMAQMLQQTEEKELSCDEVFALLDEYTEMARNGDDVAHLMPLVKQHLDMCPDCREEYEALKRILRVGVV